MIERFKEYDESHCWQYDIRINNLNNDIAESGISYDAINTLSVGDFELKFEEKSKVFNEVNEFIKRHEWLGKMSLYPTHMFTARYNGILAGVVVMDMPNAFSKMLGENTKHMERLISRGACISWSPKNLASALVSYSIRWMAANTQYRLFTAYSDTEAKELGTIYQAANFYYIGKKFGAGYQFKIESGKWVSDRYFRSRSVYKRIAKKLGITWNPEWQIRDRVIFDNMPIEIATQIRSESKVYQLSCEKRKIEPKHKYAYILGENKRETKSLKKLFLSKVKTYDYPKERGK